MRMLTRDPLRFHQTMHGRYGEIVRLPFGFVTAYLLKRPDHVRHVLQDNHVNYDKDNLDYRLLKPIVGEGLLTSNGPLWRRQRKLIQPAFHKAGTDRLLPLIVERTEAMLERWRRLHDGPFDVCDEMARLTLQIVTTALFGVDVGERSEEIGESFIILSRFVLKRYSSIPAMLSFLPTSENTRAKRALTRLSGIVDALIEERRGRPDGGDLLWQLLTARDEDSGELMSAQQLHDEVTTLLLAGHETTANALAWTFFLLSKHPEARSRLEEELDAQLGDGPLTIEHIPRLNWTRAVLQESMRLYPPAWVASRSAINEDKIGGYRIEKRALVAVCAYDTHRLPDIWPDPERFDPGRFLSSHAGPVPFAYYPFGGGPRQCIGMGLANLETVAILAAVCRDCRLHLQSGHPVEPEAMITLRPKHGLMMRAEPRSN